MVTESSLCGFDIDGICDRLENYLSEVTSERVQNIYLKSVL